MGEGISTFFDEHFIYIYFFYGLAFFAMGLALLVESRRTSQLSLVRACVSLGVFGLLHGSHEFVEMFVLISGRPLPHYAEALRIVLLAASFLPLLAFGVQMLPYSERVPGFTSRMLVLAAAAYILQVLLVRIVYRPTVDEWLRASDTLARYTLCVPGAALAGLALMRQRNILREEGMAQFGRDLAWAAIALAWYGLIGQSFPNKSIIFPSMYINTDFFRRWFGFPVQLLRGTMATIVALALIRALRAFDEEIRRRLDAAQQTEHELQSAARELSLLYEASSLLTSTNDLDTVLQESIRQIVQVIEPIKAGLIMVPGNGHIEPDHFASHGYPDDQLAELKRGKLCQCVDDQEANSDGCWSDKYRYNVTDQVYTQSLGKSVQEGIDIYKVVLPLQIGQRLMGTVMLETAPGGPYISSHDAPTILALARQLAIAIDNAQLVLQLRQREARRSELLQRTTAAQEAERKRIARELHDETGQALTGLALGLRGVEKLLERSPAQAAQQMADLQEISTRALEGLRHLISDLRPSHLDDLGLVPALRWYTEQLSQRYDIDASFRVSGDVYRLAPETETTLFRIAQEGLTNVVKHANARHTELHLEFTPTHIHLCVKDDGCGFSPDAVLKPGAGRAWGLIGIQERAALAHGDLTVQSAPGEGTTIEVRIPISIRTDDVHH